MSKFVPIYILWFIITMDITQSSATGEVKEKGKLKVDCPFLTHTKDLLTFSHHMEKKEMGYSVELIFDDFVNIPQANNSKPTAIPVYEISKKHWVISEQVVKGTKSEKTVQFTARYTIEKESDIKIVGVIFNGNVLCGDGKPEVFSLKSDKYGGRGECQPWDKKPYENATTFYIKENFHSHEIGLVMDIFFSTDVSKVDQLSNVMIEKRDKRHYAFFNSGYITSEEKPVEISFTAHHKGGPPPKLAAIIINNEVICGFATFTDVIKSDADEDEDNELLHSIDVLAISSDIISACALLVAIVTGVFAWKLTSHTKPESYPSEPIYSMPKK